MNLKISENSFRFRITPEDLDTLSSGHDIGQRICVGVNCFACRISPVSVGKEMNLEIVGTGFCLSVPHETLKSLRDMGRSKDGISIRQDGLIISLQVDLKTQMKKVA